MKETIRSLKMLHKRFCRKYGWNIPLKIRKGIVGGRVETSKNYQVKHGDVLVYDEYQNEALPLLPDKPFCDIELADGKVAVSGGSLITSGTDIPLGHVFCHEWAHVIMIKKYSQLIHCKKHYRLTQLMTKLFGFKEYQDYKYEEVLNTIKQGNPIGNRNT